MDGVREFLDDIQKSHRARGNFLGLLHILIGRRIATADGTVISSGQTWRAVADLLKTMRWDPDAVRELGIDPATLPPRDRQRYWYTAIAQAQVGSDAAIKAGDKLATSLAKAGYVIGAAPGAR
jgi:hypothetical protein